jgi:hypothetical protein
MGLLDAPLRQVASTLIGLFTDTPLVFQIKTSVYNPLTGVSVPTTVNKSVKASPPYSFTEQEATDSALQRSDLKIVVAAADAEAVGLDVQAANEKQVFCTHAGIKYRAIYVRPINSGDQQAATILALRR